MRLAVDVTYQAGSFRLVAKFQSSAAVLGLCGPSGAGKTTLLNLIAGLATPNHGRIVLDDAVLVDTATPKNLPANHRSIGYVFQDKRLFPHMTVLQNLHYGQRAPTSDEARTALEILAVQLGIADLLQRYPAKLSGGEAQRVALGRALLMRPRLLLLDEPLQGLDAARRADVLSLLEDVRTRYKIPMIVVSHHEADMTRLCDDVVMMEAGVCERG